jgi:hypothetical protein
MYSSLPYVSPGLNGSTKKSSSNVDSNKAAAAAAAGSNSTKKKLPSSNGVLQSAELAVPPSAPSGQSSNASQVIGIKEIKSKQRVSQLHA